MDKYIFGTQNKVEAIRRFLLENKLSMDNIAFIGDELNDVKLLKIAGLSFVVADAAQQAKDVADILCSHCGGDGAFREAVGILLELLDIEIDDIIESTL